MSIISLKVIIVEGETLTRVYICAQIGNRNFHHQSALWQDCRRPATTPRTNGSNAWTKSDISNESCCWLAEVNRASTIGLRGKFKPGEHPRRTKSLEPAPQDRTWPIHARKSAALFE